MIAAIVGQLLLGWLMADLLGGVIHWLQDRVLSERTPLVGSQIAAQRLHHREPLAFARGSFWERNWTTWATVAPLSLAWALTLGPSLVWGTATLGGLVTSMVHGWAHQPSTAPRLVRILQETGLLQSPAAHSKHHRPPHAGIFCVLTDWLNPWLDALNIWRARPALSAT